jgi:hypothetical protein
MKSTDELRAELAALDGQQPADQAAPTDAEQADREMIRRVFADMFGWDRAEEQKREEDRTLHVCKSCFRLQPRINTACELCSGSEEWMVPSEAKSNPEQDMFIRMAADYTVDQLRIALQSGWAKTPERERVARLLLVSKESRLNPTKVEAAEPAKEPPVEEQQIDFDAILKHYDYRIADISKQQLTA